MSNPLYALAALVVLLAAATAGANELLLKRPVPPYKFPNWSRKQVSDARQLKGAIEGAGSNTIIEIADGEYRVGGLIYMRKRKNVIITSRSKDPTKVTIFGRSFEKVDHGDDILRIGDCENITIAYVTFAENHAYGLKVQAESFPKNIHVYGCHFRNNGTRGIKGSSSREGKAVGGSVRWCRFENTKIPPANWQFGGNYITSIDMMALDGWTFADNTFINIKGRTGNARAAIFFWVRSKNVTIERNIMVGCDRGIAFGNPSGSTARTGGRMLHAQKCVARNNVIVPGPDAGIELSWVDEIKIYNNSIWRQDAGGRGIRCIQRIGSVEITNNLVRGRIALTGGATEKNNVNGPLNNFFVNPQAGDLRLTSRAGKAVNRGLPIEGLKEDFFGHARDSKADIGAIEFGAKPRETASAGKKPKSGKLITPRVWPGDPLAKFRADIQAAVRLASSGRADEASAAYGRMAEKAEGEIQEAFKLLASGTSRVPIVNLIVAGVKAKGSKRVYVDFAGRSQRVKLLRADATQATVSFSGSEMPMRWRVMTPTRIGGIARKYASSGDEHLAIARFLAAHGDTASARKAIETAHEAGLSGDGRRAATVLSRVLR